MNGVILFATLYFPSALVKEKITVAVTAALSGAVLLTAINAQLGGIGYVIAVEYVFYAFFALCLLCILSVLTAERLGGVKHEKGVIIVERSIRYLFLLMVATVAAMAWLVFSRW